MTVGTVGGGAITLKLAGGDAAVSFMWMGASATILILAVQVSLYLFDSDRTFYRQLFGVAFGVTLVWFMLCLFLPVFFIATVSIAWKVVIAVIFSYICVLNFREGINYFNRKWEEKGERFFVENYDGRSDAIDWLRVVKPMHLTVRLYVPGVPERVTPLVAVGIIISMVLGLNLRNTFPVFGAFAWGIPSGLIVSIFVQMIGIGWAQVVRIAKIEKDAGRKLKVARMGKSRIR